ncbi:MAG: demethoxyubiquinone hydroxylase family protein, partial [Gallionella sp.]|nr:demethoxyubiquinone hydroxylase family protein [Gallionella sp.]
GLLGDKWNLGFLSETEKQVGHHLLSHLDRLPPQDEKSRAIVTQMYTDEIGHADMATELGGAELPQPVQQAMKLNAKVMTTLSYRV